MQKSNTLITPRLKAIVNPISMLSPTVKSKIRIKIQKSSESYLGHQFLTDLLPKERIKAKPRYGMSWRKVRVKFSVSMTNELFMVSSV